MALTYSVQIYFGAAKTASPYNTFVPPAGYIYVVRDIQFRAPPVAGTSLVLIDQATGNGIVTVPQVAGGPQGQWSGRVVINTGQVIEVVAFDSAGDAIISGYQLQTV